MTIIAFKKVRDPFGWMSNMSPHPINSYRTAEALFQALRFNDAEIINLIKAEKSPMGAKMVAKRYTEHMSVQPRSEQDLNNMRWVLGQKLRGHPELKQELLGTGDATLIEDVTARQSDSGLFWGAGLQGECNWVGENHLGKLWMELRDKLAGALKTEMELLCKPTLTNEDLQALATAQGLLIQYPGPETARIMRLLGVR